MKKLNSLAITVVVAFFVVACGGGGGSGGSSSVSASSASVGVMMADTSTAVTDEILDEIIEDCEQASVPEDCEEVPEDCEEASIPEDCVESPEDCEEASIPEDCVEPPEECPDGPAPNDDDCDGGEGGPQLLVTVSAVYLLGPDGKEEIFSGSESIDLFDLREGLELKFLDEDVAPGEYSKIRLVIDGDPLLISEKFPDGVDVKLPSGRIDLNPRESFTIEAGDVVLVKLDWHANKSLKLVAKNKVILRPVIFVDIEAEPGEPEIEERVVRASGIVGEVGTDGFTLCMAADIDPVPVPLPTSSVDEGENGEDPEDNCIDVVVTEKTGLFDEQGEPQALIDLMQGDPVTVVGLLRKASDDMDGCDEASIPEDDCNVVTPSGASASSADNGDDSDGTRGHLEIIAAVVEGGLPGTWIRERGVLATAVDGMGEFEFRVGGTDGRLLTGKLYSGSRIFMISREEGITEVTAADLNAGDRAAVEAVFIADDTPTGSEPQATEDCEEASIPEECEDQPEKAGGTLRIAIMLVSAGDGGGIPPVEPPAIAYGKLLSVDSSAGTLMIATRTGDRCVNTDEETAIFQVIVKDGSVDAVKATLDDLQVGARIAAAGEDDGCINASIIIAQGADKPDIDPVPAPQD